VIRRAGILAVLVAGLMLVLGCVSALREPVDVADLVGTSPGSGHRPEDLYREASTLLESSADVAETETARRLFLEAASLDRSCIDCLLGASRSLAWLIEHGEEGARRKELAIEGVEVGQLCVRDFPAVAECRYRLALAVGQQARERPSTATDGLDVMVELLDGLVSEAPDLDQAGPDRVLALVLLRAPGWPAGPGDPESALDHAQNAVERFPDYPPNMLVLGEAYGENHQPAEGREACRRAVELAAELEGAGNSEAGAWRREAQDMLQSLR